MKIEKTWLNIYGMNMGLFCVLLYMYGFFPIKRRSGYFATDDSIPDNLNNIRLKREKLYTSHIEKTVIMVIDALRYDFVEEYRFLNMPHTAQLIAGDHACLLKGRVSPPTVTLPRIKALTTGSVPNFIDVIMNFKSSELKEDNIIYQAVKRKKKIVFYGDDTWLKLFPNMFTRSEGTTSFFVSDYTEVDYNVTRNVKTELNRDDWDIMILHYLGLDHIGHLEGPKSLKVGPKLKEMDHIIHMINSYLVEWEIRSHKQTLLLVCGDHGMKDSGSHGGASLAEILVPILTVGLSCSGYDKEEVLQINIAPTLSILWGIPIPADSLGNIILPLFNGLSTPQRLFGLYYNAQQVASNFLQNGGTESHEGYLKYLSAVSKHVDWLTNNNTDHKLELDVIQEYEYSLSSMSSFLAEGLVYFDVSSMRIAWFILVQVSFVMAAGNFLPEMSANITHYFVLSTLFILVLQAVIQLYMCNVVDSRSLFCQNSLASTIVGIICIFATVSNFLIIFSIKWKHLMEVWKLWGCVLDSVLVTGIFLLIVSMTATSLIEEEHQVWYFLWTTVVLAMAAGDFRTLGKSILFLILHRILRKLNHTGDKWSQIPDIGDWLVLPENKWVLSIVFLTGLCGVWLYNTWETTNRSDFNLFKVSKLCLTGAAVICIYSYRVATGCVNFPLVEYTVSRGEQEIYLFWFIFKSLIVIQLLEALYYLYKRESVLLHLQNLLVYFLDMLISNWMLLCSVLLRPHNVILLTAVVVSSKSVSDLQKHQINSSLRSTILHHWIGMVFFFYQGNSNSLSSIDVASGYIGLSDYSAVTVFQFLYANTYSAPVLAYLINLRSLTTTLRVNNWLHHITKSIGFTVLQQILFVTFYLTLLTEQRYHLFVWSVFSPKLLYFGSQTILYAVLVNATYVFMFVIRTANKIIS